MAVPYVCSACRTQIVSRPRFSYQHAVRWISNTASRRQNAPNAFTDGGSSNAQSSSRSSTRGRYSGREMNPQQFLTELDHAHAAPQPKTNPRPRNPDNSQRPPHPPPRTRTELPPELVAVLRTLFERLEARDLPAAWTAFRTIGRTCAQHSSNTARTLMATRRVIPTISNLLSMTVEKWTESLRTGTLKPDLPTPYQLLLVLHSLNNTSAIFYRPTLWHIARELSDMRFLAETKDAQAMQSGLEELMSIWRLCIGGWLTRKYLGGIHDGNRAQFMAITNDETNWSFLPSLNVFTSVTNEHRSSQKFEEMLNTLIPEYQRGRDRTHPDEPQLSDYASSALVTWDLLQTTQYFSKDGTPRPFAEVESYAPLVSMLAAMLKQAPSPRVPVLLQDKIKKIEDPSLLEQHKSMLSRLNCKALPSSVFQTRRDAKSGEKAPVSAVHESVDMEKGEAVTTSASTITFVDAPESREAQRFAIDQISKLGRALEREEMHYVEKIRRVIHIYADSHKGEGEKLPIEVYEHLMLAALSLRNAKVAIETWNYIVQAGYKPNLKTYTVMMRGAQNSRDVLGMEVFWQKMRQAGFKPDAHAWSIRIFGLTKLRSATKGLEALGEMGREWLAAARAEVARIQPQTHKRQQASEPTSSHSELVAKFPGPIDGVPKPTLELMNAAISGLSTARPQEIPKVFSWGRSFGIEPDLTTYNALLTLAMRNSQGTEALSILRRMQERGVQADSTTWTVLLTSLFESGFLDDLAHSSQENKILRFIESLNDADTGLPGIDQKAYALIIDRLIKRYGNTTAAATIYRHMLDSGRQPTAHIFTIFMTSHFQKKPQPDFGAIESLWNQIRDQGKGYSAAVDTLFYDRMIEGYAANHNLVGTKPMEDFLQHARQSGKQPGWTALENMARVYAERGEWNKLRNLIDDVRILQRENSGRMARKGEDAFWAFVHSTGILRGESNNVRPRERGSPLIRAQRAAEEY